MKNNRLGLVIWLFTIIFSVLVIFLAMNGGLDFFKPDARAAHNASRGSMLEMSAWVHRYVESKRPSNNSATSSSNQSGMYVDDVQSFIIFLGLNGVGVIDAENPIPSILTPGRYTWSTVPLGTEQPLLYSEQRLYPGGPRLVLLAGGRVVNEK